MQLFLIMTGMLAVVQLVPAMQSGQRPPVAVALRYVKRRYVFFSEYSVIARAMHGIARQSGVPVS